MKMFACVFGILAILHIHLTQGQDADPVKVTVFYEAKCLDSIRFFVNQLQPTYGSLSSIMAVDTHAYGKASDTPRPSGDGYDFTCQHGPEECYGNKVLNCGKKYTKDDEKFLDFNFCVMRADDPPSSGVKCADQVDASSADIIKCANSTEGENLLHEVGQLQAQLDPQLTYLPWILINDVFTHKNLDTAQEDLRGLVCSNYKGTPPAECSA